KTRIHSTSQIPDTILLSAPACESVTKKMTIITSSSTAKYPSATCRRGSVHSAPSRERASSESSAAEPLSAEATNRPPIAQLSLQIGWFETLSTTPVYEHKNSATTDPRI